MSTVAPPPHPQAAWVAALAGLPGLGPAMLVDLLERMEPAQAWAAVRGGRIVRPGADRRGDTLFDVASTPCREWAPIAARHDPPSWWAAFERKGIRVTWPGRPDYPAALDHDPQKPGALFYAGTLDVLERVCVAIVGTRSATHDGLAVALAMGRDLADAGVCVVSGLALGIDGAAHTGAVRAVAAGAAGSTVGVAASGVDVAYPRRHANLWREVTRVGAVVSENLPGRPAQAWRFPTRNRIIAGLVSLVVVVESHARGGSLITAEAAMARGVEVRVVPGPVRSPASEGSNQLLYDGPGPVRDARDVLDALGVVLPSAAAPSRAGGPGRFRAPAGSSEERVLTAIGGRPATLDQLLARTGLAVAPLVAALDRLEDAGEVAAEGGYWSRGT
jgi:DNA processing protein